MQQCGMQYDRRVLTGSSGMHAWQYTCNTVMCTMRWRGLAGVKE